MSNNPSYVQGYQYLFKYIIVGDSCVGKSCIMAQFLNKEFRLQYEATIGVEFGSKIIEVWDTAGQEQFKSITRSYYRGSICCILVYDIANAHSFENLDHWVQETRKYSHSEIVTLLVGKINNISLTIKGNKSDLQQSREVSYEQGADFAEIYGLKFLETSAKSGSNIEKAFTQSASDVLEKINNGIVDLSNDQIGIKISPDYESSEERKQKKGQCC